MFCFYVYKLELLQHHDIQVLGPGGLRLQILQEIERGASHLRRVGKLKPIFWLLGFLCLFPRGFPAFSIGGKFSPDLTVLRGTKEGGEVSQACANPVLLLHIPFTHRTATAPLPRPFPHSKQFPATRGVPYGSTPPGSTGAGDRDRARSADCPSPTSSPRRSPVLLTHRSAARETFQGPPLPGCHEVPTAAHRSKRNILPAGPAAPLQDTSHQQPGQEAELPRASPFLNLQTLTSLEALSLWGLMEASRRRLD